MTAAPGRSPVAPEFVVGDMLDGASYRSAVGIVPLVISLAIGGVVVLRRVKAALFSAASWRD